MQGSLLFLGTGGSMGVPALACKCSVCLSTSPFNKRRRSAALFQVAGKNLLIDAGPEIREQLLDAHVDTLDGALLTHSHFDHIACVDDLKGYCYAQKKKLPLLLSPETFEEIRSRTHYLMDKEKGGDQGLFFEFNLIKELFGSVEFAGLHFEYLSYFQSGMKVTGIKIGNLAYLSDIKDYSQKVIDAISGIDVLVISALRQTTSPMHFSIEEAIAFCRKIQAKKTYFTHVAHDVDFQRESALLPSGVQFAYDGLRIPFDYKEGLS